MIWTAHGHRLDRLDRRVHRGVIRAAPGVSAHHVGRALEESLRLAELPGEQEGRLYYFRKVSLGTLLARTVTAALSECVQRTLSRLAASSCPGTDPRAAGADAVYFDNQEQAFTAVLRLAFNLQRELPWFFEAVLSGAARDAPRTPVLRVIERLRQPDVAPRVAAGVVMTALGDAAPERLLSQLPPEIVQQWLPAMRPGAASMPVAPPRVPAATASLIRRAALQFGWRDARTVWLATIVVLDTASGVVSVDDSTVRARSLLHLLEHDPPARARPFRVATPGDPSLGSEGAASRSSVAQARELSEQPAGVSAHRVPYGDQGGTAREMSLRGRRSQSVLGEPTEGAGLYFLLHVLRALGIAETLDRDPALGGGCFVAAILKILAQRAGIARTDPILLRLESIETATQLSARLVRQWALAVRRWSWHRCNISAQQIIARPGYVWLTRSDLDVTLPLANAEIRIRRRGLDIDPGWVPWLGEFGTVVRFHYRSELP